MISSVSRLGVLAITTYLGCLFRLPRQSFAQRGKSLLRVILEHRMARSLTLFNRFPALHAARRDTHQWRCSNLSYGICPISWGRAARRGQRAAQRYRKRSSGSFSISSGCPAAEPRSALAGCPNASQDCPNPFRDVTLIIGGYCLAIRFAFVSSQPSRTALPIPFSASIAPLFEAYRTRVCSATVLRGT